MREKQLGIWLVLFCLGSGCDALKTIGESPEDKMVRLKVERIEILDELYAEYGGSDMVHATTTAAKEIAVAATTAATQAVNDAAKETLGAESTNPLVEVVAEAVSEIVITQATNPLMEMFTGAVSDTDRELFDLNCELMGTGERSEVMTTKARDFFAKEEVKSGCLKVGSLSREIGKLQGEIGGIAQ